MTALSPIQAGALRSALAEPLHRLRGNRWVRQSLFDTVGGAHRSSTVRACVRRGWLKTTGRAVGRMHLVEITPAGRAALLHSPPSIRAQNQRPAIAAAVEHSP
ncbi:hypothetical protein [Bradyrhizobium sp.]|uniref:hypothetical protein n=1 Tax=Bradyrhizobium sp. TaxID=376 RepID=UPI0025C3F9D3|nr:hypothetical protein [Bradyrhizobium sp.]